MSQQEDMVAQEAARDDEAGSYVAVGSAADEAGRAEDSLNDAGEDLEPDDEAAGDADEPGSTELSNGQPRSSVADLEQEGEIAADYIEGLLDVADLDGDIDMDVEGDRAVVSVVGATLDELVGRRGEVLEALQELTRLAVHQLTGSRTRMMLDVGGYRQRRRTELAEAERIWDRHLLNCGAIARLIPAKSMLVDLGSGAGLPGIVLAILLPGARVSLLEPLARRAEFLRECVADLGLANTQVLRGRAEDLAGQVLADVVTARAVAPLDKLAGLCVGLARPGGRVLAIKGASADAELVKARPVLARLGVTDARVVQASSAGVGATATVVTFTAPKHRTPGAGAAGRVATRADGRPAGRRNGRASAFPGAGGRKIRPNSRRAGG